MRLTDDQIRDTVATMRMSEPERQALTRHALSGDPGARLVVYAAWKRAQG